MEITKIQISNPKGLHMRCAAEVVQTAKKYESKIILCKDCKFADSCSILQILTLSASKGTEIEIIANGPDEKYAIEEISQLLTNGAGI